MQLLFPRIKDRKPYFRVMKTYLVFSSCIKVMGWATEFSDTQTYGNNYKWWGDSSRSLALTVLFLPYCEKLCERKYISNSDEQVDIILCEER